MGKIAETTWKFLHQHWERVAFVLVGIVCLGFAFHFLYAEDLAKSSAAFGVAFFSFIYSNLSRFKRFKGLGFEAELWEDKQKEAADLIARLQNIVSIYSREIVLGRVMEGRLGGVFNWKDRWSLYNELVKQHDELWPTSDFSYVKNRLDGVFIFDICAPLSSLIKQRIEGAKGEVSKKIQADFGSPIKDAKRYGEELDKLREVSFSMNDMFRRSEHENIAQEILDKARQASDTLEKHFSVKIEFDEAVINKLKHVAKLQRPLKIDDELIALTDKTEG